MDAPDLERMPRPLAARSTFDALYEDHFDFVWRNLRRLGVPLAQLDDALQDVFVVVHRRLAEAVLGDNPRPWLFAITFRVAREHRRSFRRKGDADPLPPDVRDAGPTPEDVALQREALRALDDALSHLDDDKRAVFIMADIEQMTAPEIALSLDVKLNTVYSRLRLARAEFAAALARRGGPPR
jgi:RNA polymerase sigma-70 factor, ECF subfamily